MSHLFRRSWRALAIASLLVSWTAPGAKAQSPLDFIPEDAAVVARVKSPDSIINTAKSWIPSPLQEQLLPAITELIGACGKSQDSAAECWVIEFGQSGNKSWAYVIQTSNATEKKSTYADAAMSTSIGKCQIFAGTEANGARLIDCRAGKVKSLAATMDPKARGLFEQETVSVYINARRLRALLRKDLDQLKASISETVQSFYQPDEPAKPKKPDAQAAPGKAAPVPPDNPTWIAIKDRKVFDGLLACSEGLKRLLEDTDSVTLGLTIDDKMCALRGYLAVAPGSPSDQFFARQPPSEMKPLDRLPVGGLAYFGLAGEITELARWVAACRNSTLEQSDAVKQALEQKLQPASQGPVDGYYGSIAIGREQSGPGALALITESSSSRPLRDYDSRFVELTGASAGQAAPDQSQNQSAVFQSMTVRLPSN